MSEIFASQSPEVTASEIAHAELSRRLAGECVVLMENNGVLPLARTGKLALFGTGARHTVRGGLGSGDVNTRSDVNIEQGLLQAGFTITTGDWLDRNEARLNAARKAYADELDRRAKETNRPAFLVSFSFPFHEPAPETIAPEDLTAGSADTAVYVISRNAGEGADRFYARGDYLLFDEEREQLTLLGRTYKNLVLVLNIGGVMDLSEIKSIPGIGAIVLMSQLGNIGGHVLADVLTGKVNPSGRLTDTWAKSYDDYPASATFSHNDGNVDDEYYAEGVYVGYRYFDSFGVEPLYPFGYGLSYTTFSIQPEDVSVRDGQAELSVTVTNTGAHAGKQVVQVYCSAPRGTIPRPRQELAAFQKTSELAPGQSETLHICIPLRELACYCEACACWVLEAGEYVLRVGDSSRSTVPAAVLTLDSTVKTQALKNLFHDPDPVREITAPAFEPAPVPESVVRIAVDGNSIPLHTVRYHGPRSAYTTNKTETLTAADVKAGRCTVEELTAQLTVEEMAELCVGTLRAGGGSIVGNASHTVPGAAGDTSSACKASRGIKNMILADGPAGLRLQPVFKTDKQGTLLPGGEVMGDVRNPFDPQYTDENSNTYYQYCTAIPIGWALAQSWNPALLEQIGSMVGEEMEQFGVDLWLAPALNIHRDPLCGRNFEYYSEDPLVSGLAAAAISRGVQSHPHKGVTIKHFAANSQEDNRHFSNAHVSERALREIYLKGFEIAVKTSQPLSIMTSYNLINGVHAANSYDLIQAAARDEWGFAGTVMTDWFTSQRLSSPPGASEPVYPISASTGCIFAGNDIQMPGCQKNVDDIVQAVKTGQALDGFTITLADLQFNAANVIRVAIAATP